MTNRIRWEDKAFFDDYNYYGFLGNVMVFKILFLSQSIYVLSSVFVQWECLKVSYNIDTLKQHAEEHLADWVDQAGLIFKPSPAERGNNHNCVASTDPETERGDDQKLETENEGHIILNDELGISLAVSRLAPMIADCFKDGVINKDTVIKYHLACAQWERYYIRSMNSVYIDDLDNAIHESEAKLHEAMANALMPNTKLRSGG